jgi:hypothetical protein
MMKRLNILLYSLVCLFMTICSNALSQYVPPATATGHIIAEVIPIYTASEMAQMSFGRFSPGIQGGEIVLTPESTISVLGSVYAGQGSYNAASFYLSGDADATYTITLPADPVILSHTSSAKTMKVEDWVSSPAPVPGAGRLTNGYQVVNVGATLKVGTLSDNPVGIYTGSYTIRFDFN